MNLCNSQFTPQSQAPSSGVQRTLKGRVSITSSDRSSSLSPYPASRLNRHAHTQGLSSDVVEEHTFSIVSSPVIAPGPRQQATPPHPIPRDPGVLPSAPAVHDISKSEVPPQHPLPSTPGLSEMVIALPSRPQSPNWDELFGPEPDTSPAVQPTFMATVSKPSTKQNQSIYKPTGRQPSMKATSTRTTPYPPASSRPTKRSRSPESEGVFLSDDESIMLPMVETQLEMTPLPDDDAQVAETSQPPSVPHQEVLFPVTYPVRYSKLPERGVGIYSLPQVNKDAWVELEKMVEGRHHGSAFFGTRRLALPKLGLDNPNLLNDPSFTPLPTSRAHPVFKRKDGPQLWAKWYGGDFAL